MTRLIDANHTTEIKRLSLGRVRRITLARTALSYAAALLATVAFGWLIAPASAVAGTWAVESCSLPGGQSAPIEGWQSEPDGGGPYSAATDTCPTGGLEAIDSTQWEQIRSTGSIWVYTAPPGATIAGGTLLVSLTAPQGVAYLATPHNTYDANVLVNCQFNLGCGPSNALGGWIENASVPITHTGGTQMWAVAQCVGPGQPEQAGANCAPNDGAYGVNALIRISQANIELNDANTPEGTNFSGSLMDAPASATADLNFTASEAAPGPGIYTVTVSIDGHTLSSTTPNTNGGKCVTVGRDASAIPEYITQEPCPLSEQVNIPINTTGLTDGHHELTVNVTDAAGVTATVYDDTITTENAPQDTSAPTILTPSQVFVAGALSTNPGTWTAPAGAGAISYTYQWEDCDTQGNNCTAIADAQNASYTPAPSDVGHTLRLLLRATDNDGSAVATSPPTSTVLAATGSLGALPGPGTSNTAANLPAMALGTPNGITASQAAELYLGVSQRITRTFAHRALRLTGRLLDAQGHPISSAILDVSQQILGNSTAQTITHARTRPDGTFAVNVPDGPSRLIEVAYRAFSTDTDYAAQAKIEESVDAGVQLNITPHHTSFNGIITLTGTVQGPIPEQGAIIDLLVHYRGRWEPFRTPRTDAQGHFKIPYQFEGAIGRFPFRAEVPAGQAGLPFAIGDSQVVNVITD
jgi:hypothetical protein